MPSPHQRSGDTRAGILDAANDAFRTRGYETATLDEIGEALGISRSAVLHHFPSKVSILQEIVSPFLDELDAFLDRLEALGGPLDARGRRRFIAEYVELVCRHRPVVALLTRNLTAEPHLRADAKIVDRAGRFLSILATRTDDPHDRIRAFAALGAILRPIQADETLVDLSTPESRKALVDGARAVMLQSPSSRPGATGPMHRARSIRRRG